MVSLYSVLFRAFRVIMVAVESCGCFERRLHLKLFLSNQLHPEQADDSCTMVSILYNLCTKS